MFLLILDRSVLFDKYQKHTKQQLSYNIKNKLKVLCEYIHISAVSV